MATLDRAVVWRVWIGTYTDPVLVLAGDDASLEDVARTGKVAMHDLMQGHVREEHDRQFWTDAVASKDVTKIERGDEVYLHPRVAVAQEAFVDRAQLDELDRHLGVMREGACRLKPLARRALTEGGASGDQARRDLHEAIDWLAKGAPPRLAAPSTEEGRDDG